MTADRVLIVGGGIGGLAAAAALRRVGIQAALFERAAKLQEVGAGLSLWSNAVTALARLGLKEVIVEQGSTIESAVTLTAQGRILSQVPIGDLGREIGSPSVGVHRADLQQALLAAVEPQPVQLGAECTSVDQDAEGVTVRFADGREARGSILIGADGIQSAVRRQLWGHAPPRYAGYFAFRGIAVCEHPDLPPGVTKLGLGAGTQIGLLHCGAGRIYWFATINGPQGAHNPAGSFKREALERFKGWLPLVTAVVEATEESALLGNDILDRPPVRRWGRGRISLLGDAAHPTTPNLGQGACQALEDAVVLADSLHRKGLTEAGLRSYEEARRRRTAMITRQSWWLGKLFQLENPLAIWVRNGLSSTGASRERTVATFKTLLSYQVPELSLM